MLKALPLAALLAALACGGPDLEPTDGGYAPGMVPGGGAGAGDTAAGAADSVGAADATTGAADTAAGAAPAPAEGAH